ncbi:MAG: hypothetical protein R3E79_55865 [Caldilineaceae bacterium]
MTMNEKRVPLILFWVGLLFALAFTGIGTQSLMQNLRTLTIEENNATMWADGGSLPSFGFLLSAGNSINWDASGTLLY